MSIKIEKIILSRMNFEIISFDVKEISIALNIDVKSSFPDDKQLVQNVTFDLFHEIAESPIILNFTYIGYYSGEGEGEPTLDEFSKVHAPAYIVPYARELVANITSRIGILPTLVMPPLNIHEMLKEKE
ncbi:protein-export chaperone SecB [bacterium]|nr:protein-export chaperone SecB [bacterium]